MTVLGRRKVDGVAEGYGVNVSEEEKQGRLVQHVQGKAMGRATSLLCRSWYRRPQIQAPILLQYLQKF